MRPYCIRYVCCVGLLWLCGPCAFGLQPQWGVGVYWGGDYELGVQGVKEWTESSRVGVFVGSEDNSDYAPLLVEAHRMYGAFYQAQLPGPWERFFGLLKFTYHHFSTTIASSEHSRLLSSHQTENLSFPQVAALFGWRFDGKYGWLQHAVGVACNPPINKDIVWQGYDSNEQVGRYRIHPIHSTSEFSIGFRF